MRLDALIVIGLLVLGVSVGSFAGRHFTGESSFYQAKFGPAVMIATGRGFVNPVTAPGSALTEFLLLKRTALNAGEVADVELQPLDQFQYGHRYLILAVGYIWRMSGISWANVSAVGALLYGLSVVACYAICRVWLSRPFAAVGALFICFSPLHLAAVAQVRDYSKGPFILLASALTSWAIVGPVSRRGLLFLSAACGAVVGLGLGFKMDVVVMAPIFLVSLIAFRSRRPWTGLVEKMLAAGAFVAALAIAGAPVLSHLAAGGTNGFHVILLGYADQFDDSLSVNHSVYSVLPFYSDVYVQAMVKDRDSMRTGQVPVVPSTAYDTASRDYWLTIIRHFPADALTRALAATDSILNIPFSEPKMDYLRAPAGRGNPLWNILTNREGPRLDTVFQSLTALKGWGAMLGVVLIATAGVESVRLGLFAAWLLTMLTGYSSLQFYPRHFFHLEIIPILGLLVLVRLIVRMRWPSRPEATRFAVAVVAIVLAITVPVAGLRAYQRTHLRALFQEYVDAPRELVQPVFADMGDGIWRMRWNGMSDPAKTATASANYFVVEFEGQPGPELSVVGFRYKQTSVVADFSRIVSMPGGAGLNRIFVPTYSDPQSWAFDGLELPAAIRNRMHGIYRVTHLERLPFLLDLRLSGSWQRDALNQTLRMEGGGFPGNVQLLRGETKAAPISMIGMVEASDARPNPANVGESYTRAVRVTSDFIEVDGRAETWSSYLLSLKPVSVSAPATLLVKGRLDTGGLVFGLLKDDHWYREQGTDVPGDFVAVIDITEPGTYTPIITNATKHDRDRNRFVLSRFGVTTSQATPLR